jgi:hypothetical protein
MIISRLALLQLAAASLIAAVPTDVPRWLATDPEARWVTLSADLAQEPAELSTWVAFLKANHDKQQLEWLALADDFRLPAEALVDLDADNWPRVAWWTMTIHRDSHTQEFADDLILLPAGIAQQKKIDGATSDANLLAQRHEELLYAWLHPQPGMSEIAKAKFNKTANPQLPVLATHYLPVLRSEEVFAHLKPPAIVLDLQPGEAVVPGQCYSHQVVRALDILVRSARYEPKWLAQVEALTAHAHPRLRSAAWQFFAALQARFVPYQKALLALSAEHETLGVRQAALIAYSASDDPDTELKLLSFANSPGPLRALAISCLCNRGDAWILSQLEALVLDPVKEPGLVAQREDLKQRVKLTPFPPIVPALRRAAAADLECSPYEVVLVTWTMDMARKALNQPDPVGKQTRSRLMYLVSNTEKTDSVSVRVRRYASALLSGKVQEATK